MRNTMIRLIAAVSFAVLVAPVAARADCTPGPHAGAITSDQTWCASDSPHLLADNVTVAAGATVTIQAGVTVYAVCAGPCNGNSIGMTVQGRLVVTGMAGQPVTFTLQPGASPCDHWVGITFAGGTGSLSYTTVSLAGGCQGCYCGGVGSVVASNVAAPGLVLDHCTLGPGLEDTLLVDSSTVTVSNSTFTGAGWFPIHVKGASSVLSLTNNVFTGNWTNRVLIDPGAMSGADFTLVPQTGLEAYQLNGSYTIPAGRAVTVAAGATVGAVGGGGCVGNSWGLTIQGRLVAAGTAAQPVTFTLLPTLPGGWPTDHWIGLIFDGGTGNLSYTTVSLGGGCQGCYCGGQGSVVVSDVPAPGLVLDHCTLGPSLNTTLLVTESHVTVSNSTFTGGSSFPIWVQGASSVLSLTDNIFTGNAFNRVLIDPGAMSDADFTLVPQTGLEAYQLNWGYTIPVGRTVTVEAGATVGAVSQGACYGNSYGLKVQGHLVAAGTPASPATFTYLSGGWPGDHWIGLVFDGGTGDLSHAVVSLGGGCQGCYCGGRGSVVADNVATGEVRLNGCRITGSLNAGVLGNNSHITLINTVISDSPSGVWGIQMQNDSVLTAIHTTLARNPNGALIQSGSTADLTNTIVSSTGTGVAADGSTAVTMTHTLWDNVTTPVSGLITQTGTLNGPAAFAADGYHLTGSSFALGQGVTTTVTDDIDGEARPQPALTLPDLGADEAPWHAPISRTATPIALGEVASGTAANGVFSDYVLTLAAGQATNLLVRLTPQGGSGSWSLYGRRGGVPFPTLYDAVGQTKPDGTLEMLIPSPTPGSWYLSVLYADQSGSSAPYQIEVLAVDRYVSTVSPRQGGNAGSITVQVAGLGFENGLHVQLRSGSTVALSVTPIGWGQVNLFAELNLTGLAAHAYDLCIVWPDSEEHCLAGGFTVLAGGAADVVAHLIVPDVLRGGRANTGYIEYQNTGTLDATAPLFIIVSDQDAPLRHSADEPWKREPVQILGIDETNTVSAGVLPPGPVHRVSFQVLSEGPAHHMLSFTLNTLSDAGKAQPINWSAQEAEFKPEGMSDTAWARIWPLFETAVGSTWGDYYNVLLANANYLSSLEQMVDRPALLLGVTMDRLLELGPMDTLAFDTDAACPAPGLPLTFGRSFSNGVLGRSTAGPLGLGWTHTYDMTLALLSTGDVEIRSVDGSVRRFHKLASGYVGLTGDFGRLIGTGSSFEIIESNGLVVGFRPDGRLASLADGMGNHIDCTYDGSGNLTAVTHSDGDHLTFAYDGSGRIVQLTDHAGEVTSYGYDASGRLETVTAPGGRVTQYAYEDAAPNPNALASITFADGTHVYYSYDDSGRLIGQSRDGGAMPVTFSRNASGRVVMATAGGSSFSAPSDGPGGLTLGLDALGRFAEIGDPAGNVTRFGYDTAGNFDKLINFSAGVTSMEHGPLGDVTSMTDPTAATTHQGYVYPSTGGRFPASLKDGGGNESTFTLNSGNVVTVITYPDASQENLERDTSGLVTGYTNRRGETFHYSYNARGQVTQKTLPGGSTVTYTYDAAGHLASVTDASGTTTLEHDTRGFTSKITYPSGHWLQYAYDNAGRLTQRTSDDGYTLTYVYDAIGRLHQVKQGAGTLVVAYQYDTQGRLSREDRGNGTATVYTYDTDSNPLTITHYGPGAVVQATYGYTYDAQGHVTSASAPSGTSIYTYDAAGHLTAAQAPSGVVTTYTYDAAGNRTQIEQNGVPVPYTVNALNQVTQAGSTTYSYDGNGNLTSKTTPSGTTTYNYDAENHLTSMSDPTAGAATFAYDALGQLAGQTVNGVTSSYLQDATAATGAAAAMFGSGGLVAARYIEGLGLTAQVDGSGNTFSYDFDAQGNTRALTNPSGSQVDTYDYDTFGGLTSSTGSTPNPYTFGGSGGTSQVPGGLMQTTGGYYDPGAGRDTSPSTQGYSGGPNLYTHANDNPTAPGGPPKAAPYDATGHIISGLLFIAGQSKDAGIKSRASLVGGVYGSLLAIKQANDSAEKHDTLGVWQHTAESVRSDMDILATAFPPLKGPMAIEHAIETTGKTACSLYVWNLQPNRNPHWFERTARNKWYWRAQMYPNHVIPPEEYKFWDHVDHKDQVFPGDPNEKVATPGMGSQHFVEPGQPISYTVYFENMPSASAPAQEVFVADQLDANLDWLTLQLADIGWGDTVLTVPPGSTSFSGHADVPDYRAGVFKTWRVEVTAAIDNAGFLTWTFRTIDPATGDLPEDPLAGFLPPDDGSGRGEAHVSFTVFPQAGLHGGTLITNTASVVFDTNAAMSTNQTLNTIGMPGDSNGDGTVNVGDVFYLINDLFAGGPAPAGDADCNGDGQVNVQDVFYLINYLFAAGPAPVG